MAADSIRTQDLGRLVARHSLGWLFAANLVGLWLAALLVWPELGGLVAPLTYGRWVPLHLDWNLYGWCSLPLVGVLLAWGLDPGHPAVRCHAGLALGAWSLALVLGGVAWLGGVTSGKLFLEWHGWARPLLPVAMLVLWSLLVLHARSRWALFSHAERARRVAVLAPLLTVPLLLFWASGRQIYPAVNPDSGGATGTSLLGSTLVVVLVFCLLPWLLGVAPRRATRVVWFLLGCSWLVFVLLGHGDLSHHSTTQIAGLALLFLWIPGLAWHWRSFAWQSAASPWRTAALAWWSLLVINGWIFFLPGVSERVKFTSGMVAHSHLAMAGMATCLGGLILAELTARPVATAAFWGWQAGCALQVAALLLLGWCEADDPGASYRGEIWPGSLLLLRLMAGLVMTLSGLRWWRDFSRT